MIYLGNVPESCDDSCKKLMAVEIGMETFPSVLFLILATVRFFEIKSIGFASRTTVYTKFFITKRLISLLMMFLYLALIIIIFAIPSDKKDKNVCWLIDYERKPTCLIYLVNAAAWLVSERLLRYEYRKRLSEAIYSH